MTDWGAAQLAMARSIEQGPPACPTEMFEGGTERVLLGMMVHANTISHARLVALESSFPRTRAAMGEARFNALSRAFLGSGHGHDCPLALIGAALPAWLGADPQKGSFAQLAAFELAYREAWGARDAQSFAPADFAGMDEAAALATVLVLHPACRVTETPILLSDALRIETGYAIMVRPEADVLVHALSDAGRDLCKIFTTPHKIGAAVETFLGQRPNGEPVTELLALLECGALTRGPGICSY